MTPSPSRKDVYDATLAGAAPSRPLIFRLQHDSQYAQKPIPKSLEDYRAQETTQERELRLRSLWQQLPAMRSRGIARHPPTFDHPALTPQRAEELRRVYLDELVSRCDSGQGTSSSHEIDWKTFLVYAERKEAELWKIFHEELDLDGNGHLDADELRLALDRAGTPTIPGNLNLWRSD